MLTNPGDLIDYLEVIGEGKKIPNPPLPVIAIPTTAGPGTEVTRNAVVLSQEHHVKVSMRSPMMIPKIAIVDPELTYSMPPSVTASTGMDALTQCLEAYVSNKANPLTDGFSEQGIRSAAKYLFPAYQNGHHKEAREGMCLMSLCGGLALANGGLGAVHGFAGVIGGMYGAPHGVICASLLASVMKYNVKILMEMDQKGELLRRYFEISGWLTGDCQAGIQDGVDWLRDLADQLNIPNLREIGIPKEDFNEIIEKSVVSSSMQKNPVKLSDQVLMDILSESYE
jgi:alcohol dehydrogenase class IV